MSLRENDISKENYIKDSGVETSIHLHTAKDYDPNNEDRVNTSSHVDLHLFNSAIESNAISNRPRSSSSRSPTSDDEENNYIETNLQMNRNFNLFYLIIFRN